MQKKLTSSLLIVAYCFNSLPIFAAPLPDPMEETFKNLSKGVAAYGTLKEQKRFKREEESECNLEEGYEQRFKDNSANISYVNLLSPLRVTADSGPGRSMTGYLIGVGLSSVEPSFWGEDAIYSVMAVDKETSLCALYEKKWDFSAAWRSKAHSIDWLRDELKTHLENLISKFKIQPISSGDIKQNLSYAYLRLVPEKLGANTFGLARSELGRFGLNSSEFQSETAGLAEDFLAASYSPSQRSTTFALLTKDGCLPLSERPGSPLDNMEKVRQEFLRNIFSKKTISFSKEVECHFGDLNNIFSAPLSRPAENSSTQKPFMTSAPTQISSAAPWGRVPEDFSTRSYGYGFLNDSSSNALTTTQAPYVASNGNLGYYIGAGALAVGVAAAGIGAAIYHGWKAKKPKRNAAYDGVA
ncbi:MAG: hypothetical protein ACRCYZ_00800, partial [Alphaproteobacteria bacterium]